MRICFILVLCLFGASSFAEEYRPLNINWMEVLYTELIADVSLRDFNEIYSTLEYLEAQETQVAKYYAQLVDELEARDVPKKQIEVIVNRLKEANTTEADFLRIQSIVEGEGSGKNLGYKVYDLADDFSSDVTDREIAEASFEMLFQGGKENIGLLESIVRSEYVSLSAREYSLYALSFLDDAGSVFIKGLRADEDPMIQAFALEAYYINNRFEDGTSLLDSYDFSFQRGHPVDRVLHSVNVHLRRKAEFESMETEDERMRYVSDLVWIKDLEHLENHSLVIPFKKLDLNDLYLLGLARYYVESNTDAFAEIMRQSYSSLSEKYGARWNVQAVFTLNLLGVELNQDEIRVLEEELLKGGFDLDYSNGMLQKHLDAFHQKIVNYPKLTKNLAVDAGQQNNDLYSSETVEKPQTEKVPEHIESIEPEQPEEKSSNWILWVVLLIALIGVIAIVSRKKQ